MKTAIPMIIFVIFCSAESIADEARKHQAGVSTFSEISNRGIRLKRSCCYGDVEDDDYEMRRMIRYLRFKRLRRLYKQQQQMQGMYGSSGSASGYGSRYPASGSGYYPGGYPFTSQGYYGYPGYGYGGGYGGGSPGIGGSGGNPFGLGIGTGVGVGTPIGNIGVSSGFGLSVG